MTKGLTRISTMYKVINHEQQGTMRANFNDKLQASDAKQQHWCINAQSYGLMWDVYCVKLRHILYRLIVAVLSDAYWLHLGMPCDP